MAVPGSRSHMPKGLLVAPPRGQAKRFRQEPPRPPQPAKQLKVIDPPKPPGPPPPKAAAPPTELTAIVNDGRPRRLFVGNLDHGVTEAHILQIFGKFGTVSDCAFLVHFSGPLRGKPKGFCFVEMATHELSQRAIDALNGRMLKGRVLRINFAKDDDHGAAPSSDAPAESRVDAINSELLGKGAPVVNERLLDYRASMVRSTLQRLGVPVPEPEPVLRNKSNLPAWMTNPAEPAAVAAPGADPEAAAAGDEKADDAAVSVLTSVPPPSDDRAE